MAVKESTIKRLFAKSHRQCAMPKCTSPLIIGEHVIAEICHIRARRKNGPRYDPRLTAEEKDDFKNLLLLCPTCHTLVDKNRKTYSAELLTEIKEIHERDAPLEISPDMARQALMILTKHNATRQARVSDSPVQGSARVVAASSGIAISVGGHNVGSIHVQAAPKTKTSGVRYPVNSIGADANMTNYIDYLCDLYVKYMAPIEHDQGFLLGKLGRHIKGKFRLKKRTRNQLSAERFFDLVDYLINEKLAKTPVGGRHLRHGTKLCRTFEEFRYGTM